MVAVAIPLTRKKDQTKEIYRDWRLKEFLAHMSGWDDAVIESLRAHADGTAFATPFVEHEEEHAAHLREWLKKPDEVFAERH